MMQMRVQELLPQEHAVCTPHAPAPLPEARASCNVYLTISGHTVQVTLRDQNEQQMLERLQILLDRYPAAPERGREPQAQAQAPVEPPRCPYHGPMKASTKAPGTFFCTARMGDDSYCKSRFPEK
jgi:hypothetical protein